MILEEGHSRQHGPCISLRALAFGTLLALPFWTLVILLIVGKIK